MPLHDWTDLPGWEGMHIFWMTEIARALRGRLTAGYRAVIGSSPLVAVGVAPVKPDVVVTNGTPQPNTPTSAPAPSAIEPDVETIW
jgi:predicted transcriptional regulator